MGGVGPDLLKMQLPLMSCASGCPFSKKDVRKRNVRGANSRREVKKGYAARNSSRSKLNVTRIASAGCERIGR
jgi:hypothetical protein